jgi:hypothetical protein
MLEKIRPIHFLYEIAGRLIRPWLSPIRADGPTQTFGRRQEDRATCRFEDKILLSFLN